MTSRLCVLATIGLLGLLLPASTSASFVIDNFDDAAFTVTSAIPRPTDNNLASDFGSVDRTITMSAGGVGSVDFDGIGGVSVLLLSASETATFDYHFDAASGISLHDAGTTKFLQVPFSNNIGSGSYQLTVSYQSTVVGGGFLSFAPRTITNTGDGIQVFDGTTLGNGAVASAITDLRIQLQRLSGSVTLDNLGADLQAVPEPATLALLGLSSLGAFGFVQFRRRRPTA